ncbi:MAG: GGDEF domain-containing protein [Trueperaceae bacterium]
MLSDGHDISPVVGRPLKGKGGILALALRAPLTPLVIGVGVLGLLAFGSLLLLYGSEPWPLLPWLGFTAACAILASFPYRLNRPGESYFLDFDEILLVISLLFFSPPAVVAVLVVGYLLGAMIRSTSARRLIFNAGARTTAASSALVVVSLVPAPAAQPWGYLVTAVLAAAVYSLINQVLVSRAISLLNGTPLLDELREALTGVVIRSWPVVVSYGVMVGVAGQASNIALLLGAIPVALLIGVSRLTQQRRDEHLRMTGLYRAAQEMHEARTDEDILHILRITVRRTLGVDGAVLRATPPFGDELGAWLPNRNSWVIVPAPGSQETRRQDDAFLQAVASLVEASMERATLVGELERQSLRDPLTNAFNRRYFHQALTAILERSKDVPGCLALLDIDHFKVINDTFGHEVGDAALKDLVAAASATIADDDVLCRLGGDEFALILPDLTPKLAAERLEALQQCLAKIHPGAPDRGPAGLRASIGIAAYPQHGSEPLALLRSADGALYRAKREGRNRIVVLGEPTEEQGVG